MGASTSNISAAYLLAVCVLHSKVSILQLFPTALVLAHVSAIFSIVTEFIHFPHAFVVSVQAAGMIQHGTAVAGS